MIQSAERRASILRMERNLPADYRRAVEVPSAARVSEIKQLGLGCKEELYCEEPFHLGKHFSIVNRAKENYRDHHNTSGPLECDFVEVDGKTESVTGRGQFAQSHYRGAVAGVFREGRGPASAGTIYRAYEEA
jgi:hypothetical protein